MPLTFCAATHTYQIDGITLPSVTQVLQDAGIIDYSHVPEDVRKQALERGRRVHSATAYWDEGDLEEASISDDIRPHLKAWQSFRQSMAIRITAIEVPSHYRQSYAGTPDRICEWTCDSGISMAIIDLKTGKAEPWVRYQLAAYAAFQPRPRAYRRVCVELHDDQTFTLYEFPATAFDRDWNVFLAALTVYQAKRSMTL